MGTNLRLVGDYNDPWLVCPECDMRYQVEQKSTLYDHIEYCPWCGEGVDSVIDELKGGSDE